MFLTAFKNLNGEQQLSSKRGAYGIKREVALEFSWAVNDKSETATCRNVDSC